MKYLGAILFVLATAFIYQNDASPSDGLNRLERTVNNTVAFLQNYKVDLAVDGDRKYNNALTTENAKIVEAANQTFQEIQNSVEEANNDGKNAEECLNSAQLDVSNALNRVVPVVGKCFEDNEPNWEPLQNATEHLVEDGEELLERINGIRVECANSTQEQVCVGGHLPKVAGAVGLYKLAVGHLKLQVSATLGMQLKKVAGCAGLPLITYRIELKNAKHNAHECINAAGEGTTANVMES